RSRRTSRGASWAWVCRSDSAACAAVAPARTCEKNSRRFMIKAGPGIVASNSNIQTFIPVAIVKMATAGNNKSDLHVLVLYAKLKHQVELAATRQTMKTVSMLQFRRKANAVLRQVRNGQAFVLTYRGQPVA